MEDLLLRPGYWVSFMYKRTIGTQVLNASSSSGYVRAYVYSDVPPSKHSARECSVMGAVQLLLLNLHNTTNVTAHIATTHALAYTAWTLSPPRTADGGGIDPFSHRTLLNGQLLPDTISGGKAPFLEEIPVAARQGEVADGIVLPPLSVSFVCVGWQGGDTTRPPRGATASTALPSAAAAAAVTPPKPHLILSLVDDLGYSSVGFNSPTGEPLTPVIDGLARSGAILSHHYAFRFCSPSRSSFLSGRLPLHVNQQNHPPNVPGGGVPQNMTTIATILKREGYSTIHAGKWHGGMSHANLLPINRGFDTSLAMLSGSADHWTNIREGFVDMWLDNAPAHGLNGTYSLDRYMAHALGAIDAHDPRIPFFLYMAFQDVHGPTEAPQRFLDLYPTTIHPARRRGLAQISAVDEAIGNLTGMLRAKGMWDASLFVFSADNGGPADHEPNFPLRGAKGADFEGGVRTVAFATGGVLPRWRRGGPSIEAQMHLCDWYATFARLAGVTDLHDAPAAAAGLPPVDAIDMWPAIVGNISRSPRAELPLSGGTRLKGTALIVECPSAHCPGSRGRYKLVRGKQTSGFFPGPTTPNGTKHGGDIVCATHGACLFDLSTDPIEHVDLAADKPELLHRLKVRASELDATVYQSPGGMKGDPASKRAAREIYGGFWGPWQDDAQYGGMGDGKGWSQEECEDCQ